MIEKNLALDNFILESMNMLGELNAFHTTKSRQIENCFQKLIDNIPKDIANLPINHLISDYLKIIQSKEFYELQTKEKENLDKNQMKKNKKEADTTSNDNDCIDSIIGDHDDKILNFECGNLTSTVKKATSGKDYHSKYRLDAILNAQSIIQEHEATAMTTANETITSAKENQEKNLNNKDEDYSIKIIYFMNNLSKVMINLNEITNVDFKHVHEQSANDLKKIRNVFATSNNANKK